MDTLLIQDVFEPYYAGREETPVRNKPKAKPADASARGADVQRVTGPEIAGFPDVKNAA